MIEMIPIGGLCNRLRAFDSAIALAQEKNVDLKVYWESNIFLNSPFSLLFEPIKNLELIDVKQGTFKFLPASGTYDICNSYVFELNKDTKIVDALTLAKLNTKRKSFCDELHLITKM